MEQVATFVSALKVVNSLMKKRANHARNTATGLKALMKNPGSAGTIGKQNSSVMNLMMIATRGVEFLFPAGSVRIAASEDSYIYGRKTTEAIIDLKANDYEESRYFDV